MSPARTSRLVVAALVLFALWPLAQHVLARTQQINPWKLGGFAMYTTPAPPLEIGWIAVGAKGPQRIDPDALPAALGRQLRAFEARRHALGRLASPVPTARLVLSALPQSEAVMVVIRRYELDARTAHFRMSEEREVVSR